MSKEQDKEARRAIKRILAHDKLNVSVINPDYKKLYDEVIRIAKESNIAG